MRFKNITCLTKVSKNQTQTERNETSIIFNSSLIEINDNMLNVDIKDREVFFIASTEMVKEVNLRSNRPTYTVNVGWVKVFKDEKDNFEIPQDATDILIITREIYKEFNDRGYSDLEIYTFFKEKGLGQMSVDLPSVSDFSALTAQILE